MKNIKFIAIQPETPILTESPQKEICQSMRQLYARVGFHKPWIGYLVHNDSNHCVGTCGYKSAPQSGRVEIAYFTFPQFEGLGVATVMTRHLVSLALNTDPKLKVFAQTLPEKNASTSVLNKNDFKYIGEVIHPEDGLVWEWEHSPE
jgi:ribosomal-protein-alanine N-acetyltransferase